MTKIDVTVHLGGVFDGWSKADLAAVDFLDTEAKLASVLGEQIKTATGADVVNVEVRCSDEGDRWSVSGARDEMGEHDLDEAVRDTLMDFPWYDAQRWAVFK